MSTLTLNKYRDLSHDRKHSLLLIHKQSNTEGELDPDTKTIPLGQAGMRERRNGEKEGRDEGEGGVTTPRDMSC